MQEVSPFGDSPVQVIDTHTAGEPTRVIVSGGPELGGGPVAAQCDVFRKKYDHFRSAVVNEPRGTDVLVGALIRPSQVPEATAAVIFFNNVGTLGMCGHGTIGVVVALAYQGLVGAGEIVLETPAGIVRCRYDPPHQVTVMNVAAYRTQQGIAIRLASGLTIRGDVAWGGNWFFITEEHGLQVMPENLRALMELATELRLRLAEQDVTGDNGAVIDHIELSGPPTNLENHSRNFVLCPGMAYDRSPCGTGTSAKIACLVLDGKLKPGAIYRQEGILGTVFEASGIPDGHVVWPQIVGSAYVTGTARLLFDPGDPFQFGIRRS